MKERHTSGQLGKAGVPSLKFLVKIEKGQMQILRLTTPKLCPKEQRQLIGDP